MVGGRQGAVALVALCTVLALPSAAQAIGEPGFGCKRVYHGDADINPNPKGDPPLAIGDSTMLLPIPNLNAVGYSVNAKGCRGFRQAVDVAAKARKKHQLPHLVLINAYSNGGVNPGLIRFALKTLGPSRVLGLITEYNADTGHPPAPDTNIIQKAAKQYPHQIVLLDWVSYSLPHHFKDPLPNAWFLPDLFHPNFAGADAYAQFLARALPLAEDGRFPPLP
jgi:hypothetical protein